MKAEPERWNSLTEEEREAEEALEYYVEASRICLDWARDEVDRDCDPRGLSSLRSIRLEVARQWWRKVKEPPDLVSGGSRVSP